MFSVLTLRLWESGGGCMSSEIIFLTPCFTSRCRDPLKVCRPPRESYSITPSSSPQEHSGIWRKLDLEDCHSSLSLMVGWTPKYPLMDECIKEMCMCIQCICIHTHTHTHTMEYYSAIKRNSCPLQPHENMM